MNEGRNVRPWINTSTIILRLLTVLPRADNLLLLFLFRFLLLAAASLLFLQLFLELLREYLFPCLRLLRVLFSLLPFRPLLHQD